jgi:hypothetical protein
MRGALVASVPFNKTNRRELSSSLVGSAGSSSHWHSNYIEDIRSTTHDELSRPFGTCRFIEHCRKDLDTRVASAPPPLVVLISCSTSMSDIGLCRGLLQQGTADGIHGAFIQIMATQEMVPLQNNREFADICSYQLWRTRPPPANNLSRIDLLVLMP